MFFRCPFPYFDGIFRKYFFVLLKYLLSSFRRDHGYPACYTANFHSRSVEKEFVPWRGLFSENVRVRPSAKNSAQLIGITAGPILIIFFKRFLIKWKKSIFCFVFEKKNFCEKSFFAKKKKKLKKIKISDFFLDSPFVSPLGAC